LVLGAVRLFQPVHGYEVRRELLSWRADEWASVAPGSIYNALKSLTREGLLEVVGTKQVAHRPERTSYRLTRAGDDALRGLLYDAWWTVKPLVDALAPAVSFLGLTPRADAIAALAHRRKLIAATVTQLDYAAAHLDESENPDHVREMLRLARARVASEVEWAEKLEAALKKGEYLTADDPPWKPGKPAKRGKKRRRT
jgi:DNA-binding PadR family transcriptional regulator